MRPFFDGFAGPYWWYGPRIHRRTGQTTPERCRQFQSLHAPNPPYPGPDTGSAKTWVMKYTTPVSGLFEVTIPMPTLVASDEMMAAR